MNTKPGDGSQWRANPWLQGKSKWPLMSLCLNSGYKVAQLLRLITPTCVIVTGFMLWHYSLIRIANLTVEALFLVWGIRLCIVVRKAPSEFNESRFISMAIYNEFLLSVFLNISMLFLQSPANPDLLYIIFFAHTQLTVTILLGLIFGSKVWLVARARGRPEEDGTTAAKPLAGKFASRARSGAVCGQGAPPSLSSAAAHTNPTPESALDTEEELRRLTAALEILRERSLRAGDRRVAARAAAMQEAARAVPTPAPVSTPAPAMPPAAPPPQPAQPGLAPGAASPPQSRPPHAAAQHMHGGASPTASPGTSPAASTAASPGNVSPAAGSPATEGEAPNARGRRRRVRDRPDAADERRSLKSGHARTHAIVINLDDRSRFTEEVTV